MTDETLLPCPFCGGEAYVAFWDETEGVLTSSIAEVRCDCGVRSPMTYGNGHIDKAVALWNTRVKDEREWK